jgi:uncharacterized protein (TIGR02466 family)
MENTFDLFSVPVHVQSTQLDNETMAKYCLNLMNQSSGRIISNQGGWQSEDLQGIHYPLNELFKSISKAVNVFASQLYLPEQKIDNIWININGYKDFNMEHRHPNSHLSGVYYIQTHKDCGDITFSNPYTDIIEAYWWPYIADKNKNDPRINLSWQMPAETGKLYVFPSWLPHRVLPNLDKEKKRISISWNTHVKD